MTALPHDPGTDAWVAHRNLLFTVAYEMLGSAADAEDVLQESWLRWSRVPVREILDTRAYLVRITTRLALDHLRAAGRRREEYVGPWLPEPLLTSPDVAEDVELAESVSTAMLLVLETLSPAERAVFVLREVFEMPYEEIAEAVDKTPAAVRQIAHRARGHVMERRPRQVVATGEWEAVTTRLVAALDGGDLQPLADVLAPDVVLLTDGGGVKRAALKPIRGVDKVLRFLGGVYDAATRAEMVRVNGGVAVRLELDGELEAVATFTVDGGRITHAYIVRNPHKLAAMATTSVLTRGRHPRGTRSGAARP